MIEGAIGIVDCLGFKGIWRRADAEKILAQLELARREASQVLSQGFFKTLAEAGASFPTAFISDTIVVGASIAKNELLSPPVRGMLVQAVGAILQRISARLILGDPPIAVRGVIHWGEYLVNGTYIIGQAVDEAVELHEAAEGAFVWASRKCEGDLHSFRNTIRSSQGNLARDVVSESLTRIITEAEGAAAGETLGRLLAALDTDTFKAYEPAFQKRILNSTMLLFLNYHVPIKGGGTIRCMALNSALCSPEPINPTIFLRYSQAMESDSLNVMIKEDNTLRFLHDAAQPVEQYRQHWKSTVGALLKGEKGNAHMSRP